VPWRAPQNQDLRAPSNEFDRLIELTRNLGKLTNRAVISAPANVICGMDCTPRDQPGPSAAPQDAVGSGGPGRPAPITLRREPDFEQN
jgi:hypothetical protein